MPLNDIDTVAVSDLFGHANHEFSLHNDEVTILTAPNGAGKTHVMRTATELLSLDLPKLIHEPFGEAVIGFRGGSSLSVSRRAYEDAGAELSITAADGKGSSKTIEFTPADSRESESLETSLPSIVRRSSYSTWVRGFKGSEISFSQLSSLAEGGHERALEKIGEVLNMRHDYNLPSGVFIDTKRLYELPSGYGSDRESLRERQMFDRSERATARMNQYISHLRNQLAQARRETVETSQRADMKIANRLMSAATATVNEDKLRARYLEAIRQQEGLAANSLAISDAPVPLPGAMNPTQKRILSVVLDDWERRLAPLIPLNDKINTLRRILDGKLKPSGKSTAMSANGELQFRDRRGRKIRVATLSSGEQHLVALYTSLLFATDTGAVVCIDEPELSLHAAWQHAFVDDITEVAKLTGIQIMLATHSTAIINGRWELTRSLELQAPSAVTVESGDPVFTLEGDSDDDFDF